MELVIANQQDVASLPVVKWNFEELKQYALDKADEYKGIAYTEDDAAAMKADRADINRFLRAIDAERIQKKKEYLKPYNEFEAQVKEVLKPLQEAEALIAKGLKEIYDKWREERKEKVREIYEAHKGALGEVVPFESVLCDAYLKKSTSVKAIDESLGILFDRVAKDVEEIEELTEKYRGAAMTAYKASGRDLSAALAEVRQIQKAEAEMEERRRKAAEQDAKAAEIREAYRAAQETKQEEQEKPEQEPILELSFRVYGTREQILSLRDYMKAVDLRFERVV